MKLFLLLFLILPVLLFLFRSQVFGQGNHGNDSLLNLPSIYNPYSEYPVYQGKDMGVTYTPAETILKVWSPPAQEMKLRLYKTSTGSDLIEEIVCKKDADGVWSASLSGDRKNLYYTFSAKIKGKWMEEQPDPYAKAVGVNGKRAQIIDLAETNPPGWENDKAPALKNFTDALIYELHIRDLSIAPNSGLKNKGKYLAFTEFGIRNKYGQSTGIDHLLEMGVTHVHLLPAFDFLSMDESKPEVPQFNWGYDPQNYNTPEGSYSTNPEDGKVRIREFKQMVQALHTKGMRVVMDVVYNHTGLTHNSVFDQLVPGYYYRQWQKDGSYSNASGCGNETASERAMVRKFILESVLYWVKEYHIDGFRFDLMAIHDMETMNMIASELHAIDPSILIYGEGWTAGDSPLPVEYRALKMNAKKMKGIAVFSDDIRDAIKGSVFDDKSTGFASGFSGFTESVRIGIVGAGPHPQIDYSKGFNAKEPYTNNPVEVINYVSCHDNHTLYDKLKVSRPDATEEELIMMHKLANTIVMTSQGIPFLHAGVEMKRTKGGDHNSYNKPDSVNQIDWEWKYTNRELVAYYKGLVFIRKAHAAFRMPSNELVQKHLSFLDTKDPQVIAYVLKDHANGEAMKNVLVCFNGSATEKTVEIPGGIWKSVLENYSTKPTGRAYSGKATLPKYSALILVQR